jgi:hypothetical protein
MLGVIVGYDCTHNNIPNTPHNAQLAGYTTGTPDIKWTPEDFAAFPKALRICQDEGSDVTADYIDDEAGAATDTSAAEWYPKALSSYESGKRPGQHHPSIYKSADGITPLVNSLIANGITSGPGLIVADWDLTQAQAVADVQAAAGPFPIRGIQFHNEGAYDIDIWDLDWVNTVSGVAVPFRHVLPGTIEQFAQSRDANSMNLFNRSEAHWTSADKQEMILSALKMIVYTTNP